MVEISTIGLDIAKRVFQVHGVDAAGKVVLRRQLRRGEVVRFFAKLPPCLVGMEACATAHCWGRQIAALGHPALGHRVRLMPPTRVKPYVKWGQQERSGRRAGLLRGGEPAEHAIRAAEERARADLPSRSFPPCTAGAVHK